MRIQFYEVTDIDERAYAPPWLTMLNRIDAMSGQERQFNQDIASVYWRNEADDRTSRDGIVELARTRSHSPAVTDRGQARTGPAPDPGKGRAYSERVLGAMVDDRVVACLRLGGGSALSTTIASHLNAILGLVEEGNPIGGPMRFLRILSPQFVDRLREEDSVVAGIELQTSYGGLRRLYDRRGVLARSERLRNRNTGDRVKVGIKMALDTRKKKTDSLTETERLDAEALLEEALELVQEADEGVKGTVTMITPRGRRPVYLGEAHLTSGVRFSTDSPYIDPLEVLDKMHREYAPLMSQVRSMLR